MTEGRMGAANIVAGAEESILLTPFGGFALSTGGGYLNQSVLQFIVR